MEEFNLYHADCFDILPLIDDESVKLVCVDLPYGNTENKWDSCLDLGKLWVEYKRIVTGAIVIFGKQPFTTDLINSNRSWFKYELIWEKDKPNNFGNANRQPMCYHENILVFYNKQPTYNKQLVEREGGGTYRYQYEVSHQNRMIHGTERKYTGKKEKLNYDIKLKNPKSILYFNTGRRQELLHPTQKPLKLLEWIVATYTNEGDLVLDNCMGSNTCGLACKNLKRKFIGIEKEKQYFDISLQRIS